LQQEAGLGQADDAYSRDRSETEASALAGPPAAPGGLSGACNYLSDRFCIYRGFKMMRLAVVLLLAGSAVCATATGQSWGSQSNQTMRFSASTSEFVK
jgi:hypothetical protein